MKKRISKVTALVLGTVMAAGLLGGCGSNGKEEPAGTPAQAEEGSVETSAAESADGSGVYKIALSNHYMGNDWRQQMCKVAEVVASKDPFKDKVELTIVNTDNSAEAQSASIDALAQQGYDAIIVNAASPTALNPAIERASEQGVIVVSFDTCVTSEAAWKVEFDSYGAYLAQCKWLAEIIGGEGNVVLDQGLPGTSVSADNYAAAEEVFNSYPGITIVSDFTSEYAEGPGEQGLSSVIAANPNIDAVMTQAYVSSVVNAFNKAGKDPVPSCGSGYNGNSLACLNNNVDGIIHLYMPGIAAVAMQKAVEILDGEDVEKDIKIPMDLLATSVDVDLSEYEGRFGSIAQMEKGVNCFEDQPDALIWPCLPADFPVQVTMEEIIE